MNYWLLTTEYPPMHGGGISTYCRCTAEMLSGRGVAVTVIVADEGVRDVVMDSREQHLLVVRFNPGAKKIPAELGGTARLSYAYYLLVRELIGELGVPDVIESQDYLGIAYYLQQFKLLRYEPLQDIPIVVTIHAPAFVYFRYNRVPVYRFPNFWTGEMEKSCIRAADCLFSPSRFMAEEVGKYMDLSASAPVLLPYAYRPVTTSSPAGFRRNKIVYYGKLSPQKGSFELLRYFDELWKGGFEHPLHIIGGTDIVYHPEKLTMGQLVERDYGHWLRRGRILLHPAIDPACIGVALADAHVVLLPSIVDNLPYVCLEAMACGKVVLASVQGGQREIIEDGMNGFLFDHGLPESFADRLRYILELPDDEVERTGQAAKDSLCRYDYPLIGDRKMAVLEEVVSGYRAPDNFPFVHGGSVAMPGSNGRESVLPGMLSVVIPFYNLGEWLDDCIRSVLASGYRLLEVIVVNDGSTGERDLAALERWRDHPAVTVLDQVNGGLPRARNLGARRAGGEFLAFLDADDLVLPDYYEKAIRVLTHYDNVHFVGCWVRYFDGGMGVWPAFNPGPPYLLTHNTVNSSALVYKRAAFLHAGQNDPALVFGLEDYESVVNLVHHGYNGVVLPECLHRYRVREGSMFRRANGDKLLYSNSYIQEKHTDYYQRYATEVAQLLNSNGPGYLFENPTLAMRVSSQPERPRSLAARLKRFAGRHRGLKKFLLGIQKKTDGLWPMAINRAS